MTIQLISIIKIIQRAPNLISEKTTIGGSIRSGCASGIKAKEL